MRDIAQVILIGVSTGIDVKAAEKIAGPVLVSKRTCIKSGIAATVALLRNIIGRVDAFRASCQSATVF